MKALAKLKSFLGIGKKSFSVPLTPDTPSQLTKARIRNVRSKLFRGAFGKVKPLVGQKVKVRPLRRPSRPAIYRVQGGKPRSKYMPHTGKKQQAKEAICH